MDSTTQNKGAPGLGWVFFNTMTPQGVGLWQGGLKLPTDVKIVASDGKVVELKAGHRVVLQATAIRGPAAGPGPLDPAADKKTAKIHKALVKAHEDLVKAHVEAGGDRYEFKIMDPGSNPGDKWKHISAFVMPAFGNKPAHVVDTAIGRLRSWKQAPRADIGACIRFRVLKDADGKSQNPMPM